MSTNEELAIASPVTDKQLIDDNSSSMTKVSVKYGVKNYGKKSEDHIDLEEDGQGIPLSVFNTLIDSVIKLDPDEVEPNVPKLEQKLVQGLTSDPLDFHPNIDYDEMINSGEIPICPEKIEEKPELERPVTRNTFRSESQCSEGPILNIKGKPSYFRLNLDVNEEFLSERSASHESSGDDENFNSEEQEKPDMIENKKSNHKEESVLQTSSVSQTDSEHSEKNDYMNMINQEIYSIVNAISPQNLKAIEISEENILPSVLESNLKPMVIEDSDAHCIFGWSLLSPGVMEIKINPDSDDTNDIIRVRRTSSLKCHIESGDITKLNILKENENSENSNDNGDMDYIDFIGYLAQASNRGYTEADKTIVKEASMESSTEHEVKTILQETTQQVDQKTKQDEELLLAEDKSIKEKTSDVKNVQMYSEMIPADEEKNTIAYEKSSISIKVVESDDQIVTKTHSVDTHKSKMEEEVKKKDGKKRFSPLKKLFKSKKSLQDDSSKKLNEGKKNKSWFRFWF